MSREGGHKLSWGCRGQGNLSEMVNLSKDPKDMRKLPGGFLEKINTGNETASEKAPR